MAAVTLHPLANIPLIEPGDDLGAIVAAALTGQSLGLVAGDILVLAQKIVSKAEGRYVDLASVEPTAEAREIALRVGKDPRHVQVVLSESDEVVKIGPRVVVTAHRRGYVMANAGIDESNVSHDAGDGGGGGGADSRVLLLPEDPDGSARALQEALHGHFGVRPGIVINDSFGRPWRNGVVGVALGAAGVPALVNRVGDKDLFGRTLKVTEIAWADELASAASLVMGQADEGLPVVLVRGLEWSAPERPASALIRPRAQDMFR